MHGDECPSGRATFHRTFFSGLKRTGGSCSEAAIPEQFIPLKPGQIWAFLSVDRSEQLYKIHDVTNTYNRREALFMILNLDCVTLLFKLDIPIFNHHKCFSKAYFITTTPIPHTHTNLEPGTWNYNVPCSSIHFLTLSCSAWYLASTSLTIC